MFATWDIETTGLIGDMVIGSLYDGDKNYDFTSWDSFFKNIYKHIPDKSILYSHNGGKFDNKYLLEYIENNDRMSISNFMNISGRIIFTLTIKGKRYYFRDSMLHLPASLKELCLSFEVGDNSKKDFDIKNWLELGCPITDELIDYLHYDCIALFEVLQKYYNIVGKPKITIASTAFNILQETKYNGIELKNLLKNFLTIEQENYIRESYKGGRVEVFKRYGDNQLFHYDVNSLYPYVMKNRKYPYGRHKIVVGNDDCKRFIESGKLGIIRCDIEIENMQYPYLAKIHDNKLLFPVGKWKDTITTIEYEKCIKLGYKINIEDGIFYEKSGYLFKEYVDTFYKIKQTSTGAKKAVAKLLLNSAYGKFGQKRTFSEYLKIEDIINKGDDLTDYVKLNDMYYMKNKTSYQNRKINPVIASFITAYARDYLYSGMELIINNGGTVYYVDTDSIFCDIRLPDNIVNDSELGYWSLEDIATNAVFVSPKQYQYYDGETSITKMKGISNPKLNMQQLVKRNTATLRIQERMTGYNEHYKRHDTDKSRCIGMIKQEKYITSDMSKRILCDNGRDTQPIRLFI
jgi:DNA polymerase elongation subunit (family B)